jgi:hypothetical protein
MNMDADREEKAIQALITGALHRFSPEVTAEEIEEFLKSECILSPEGKAALEKLGDDPLAKRVAPGGPQLALEVSGEYAAMHRELDADELDEQTKEELRRKREEILRRIREKRGESE